MGSDLFMEHERQRDAEAILSGFLRRLGVSTFDELLEWRDTIQRLERALANHQQKPVERIHWTYEAKTPFLTIEIPPQVETVYIELPKEADKYLHIWTGTKGHGS